MDTLTHALSGALLARATAPRRPGPGSLPLATRTWVGFLAAAFPDIDFALSWVDSLLYLNWHRGHTHSVVLLPLWTLLLAFVSHRLLRGRYPLRAFYGVCALGVAIHIAGDVITTYGTRIFVPLSDVRVSLPTTFIIDPWFTGILAAGLLASMLWPPRRAAAAGLLVLAAYVGLQGLWYREALELARDFAAERGLSPGAAHAMPQPFSPVNWKLVVTDGDIYHQAYVRLHGRPVTARPDDPWWRRVAAAYRQPDEVHWNIVEHFGDERRNLAREAWKHPGFSGFRQFAVLPFLYGIDEDADRTCVWFTDLRFVLESLTPPFRYGMCREGEDGEWRLERLGRW